MSPAIFRAEARSGNKNYASEKLETASLGARPNLFLPC